MSKYIKERWWLIIVGFALGVIAHGPILFEHYVINGDSTAILLWMNGLTLEKIAPNAADIMTSYANYFVSVGAKGIYAVLSCLMPPIIAVKIVPLITSMVCILMMYEIGYFIGGKTIAGLTGGIFLLLAWYYRHREMFGSADAEEIAIVLMLGFLLTVLQRRFLWTSIILLVSALTYPPLFVLEVGTLGVFLLIETLRKRALPLTKRDCFIIAISCLFAGIYLVGHVFLGAPDFLGRILTYKEALAEGMFNIGGRTPMFGDGSLVGRILNDASGIGIDAPKTYLLIVFFCMLCLPLKVFKRKLQKIFPLEMWYFLAAGIILTVIANIVLFKLYQPSRYIQIPLNIFLTVFVACAIVCFEDAYPHGGRWLKYSFMIGLFCIVAPRLYGHLDGPFRERNLVEYVKTLPDTSFLAGHPREVNGIGLFAKKRIFLTRKMATEVYWKTYQEIMAERTQDFFRAYYAETANDVSAFAKKYGITHIILYARHFSKDYLTARNFYDSPFNDFISDYVGDREQFFLSGAAEIYKKENGLPCTIFVFDCNKMEIIYGTESLPPDSFIYQLAKKYSDFHVNSRP